MAHILVVDDESKIREVVARLLTHRGHRVTQASTAQQAIAIASADKPEVIVMDVALPDLSGVDAVARLQTEGIKSLVIFMTAHGSVRSAVSAMKAGGFDYFTKPFDNDDLLATVDRALEVQSLGARVASLEADLKARTSLPGIVGTSEGVREVLKALSRVAPLGATVLLLGESGTGKELVARSLHRQSSRARGPFVALNCAAITPTLAESELFGHEKGAFTGASESRRGRWEQAQGGTLFLDEVGELSLEVQAKLLRVLQEHEVVRVGGNKVVQVDARIVAATNRDLRKEVLAGRFREDLYWRLSTFPIHLPPLRERKEDIPLLVDHLLDVAATELGVRVREVSGAAMAELIAHAWPGNVRELGNVLRRALIVADGELICPGDLLLNAPSDGTWDKRGEGTLAEVVARTTDRVEREMIETALAKAQGNRTAAALQLGINRRTLFSKMKRLLLTVDDYDLGDPDKGLQ